MIEMKSKLEKRLEEKISFLNESLLIPLDTHGSSSSRSTYSTPRHQLSSSSRSKYLFREQASNASLCQAFMISLSLTNIMGTWMHAMHLMLLGILLREPLVPWKNLMISSWQRSLLMSSSHCLSLAHTKF